LNHIEANEKQVLPSSQGKRACVDLSEEIESPGKGQGWKSMVKNRDKIEYSMKEK